MHVTVLVPTYRRPATLVGVLDALKAQTRAADEILLVVRVTDEETHQLLQEYDYSGLPVRVVPVTVPGQVAALNAGVRATTGDVVAITDDDTKPWPVWLEKIEKHFLDNPQLGGVGGRDWVYHGAQHHGGQASVVGRIQWFGRPIGNHHLEIPGAVECDFLKGCNMSYRMEAIRSIQFDTRLRGPGSQITNDMGFGLRLRRQGWKILFDPEVALDHYPAERLDDDKRNAFHPQSFANIVHNETVVVMEFLSPVQRVTYLVWAFFVGSRLAYGVVQALRFTPSERKIAWTKFGLTVRARLEGMQTVRRPE